MTIKDFEGDEVQILLNYDSTTKPLHLAVIQFIVTDKGSSGTYVDPDDLEAMANWCNKMAVALRVADKKPTKRGRKK